MKIHVPVRRNFSPYVYAEKYPRAEVITRKPILPSAEELEWNSQLTRVQNLRVFERQISEAK